MLIISIDKILQPPEVFYSNHLELGPSSGMKLILPQFTPLDPITHQIFKNRKSFTKSRPNNKKLVTAFHRSIWHTSKVGCDSPQSKNIIFCYQTTNLLKIWCLFWFLRKHILTYYNWRAFAAAFKGIWNLLKFWIC